MVNAAAIAVRAVLMGNAVIRNVSVVMNASAQIVNAKKIAIAIVKTANVKNNDYR